ncbi:predicted protein [Methanosarcina acetivorans C2A]|uniref:Uncharacterized protein n=1 Tax=Methanosarcina acetivorans (strain ATCC 35395 / DSM 2834 / JCM 12185 / C2A) TaxID=188937 RepID=Q8TQT8_METAC|nr:predicted protein [Methanosarcina acetivorans C2A]
MGVTFSVGAGVTYLFFLLWLGSLLFYLTGFFFRERSSCSFPGFPHHNCTFQGWFSFNAEAKIPVSLNV